MPDDIQSMIKELRSMTVPELRRRYAEVFGEPTGIGHKQHLVKRVAWRVQALREGDLSERARRRAAELAQDADLRLTAPRERPSATSAGTTISGPLDPGRAASIPRPGTVLRRRYKDRIVLVRVLAHGFEHEGEVHRSLTAIARKVTGSHWNGVSFFGLAPTRGRATEGRP